MATAWSREEAIKRLEANELMQEVMDFEPAFAKVIHEAMLQEVVPGYRHQVRYTQLRNRAAEYVGFDARLDIFATSEYYDAMLATIDDLLPPDPRDEDDTDDTDDDDDDDDDDEPPIHYTAVEDHNPWK